MAFVLTEEQQMLRDSALSFAREKLPVSQLRALLEAAGKTVVIPSRSTSREPREYDKHLYKERHLIENFFAKLKQFRCIATRYDKTARNFLGAIHFAAAVVWLN